MAWSVVLFWSFVLLNSFKGCRVILGENLHGFVFLRVELEFVIFLHMARFDFGHAIVKTVENSKKIPK